MNYANSRGHTKAWEWVTRTLGTTQKPCNESPQSEGPQRSVRVYNINLKGRTKAPKSISSTQRDTSQIKNPAPQLEGPHPDVWQCISPIPATTPRRGIP